MAKVIRESRRTVMHECHINHAKKGLDRYLQEFPKEERQLLYGLGKRSWDWFDRPLHQYIPRDKKIEMWENTLNHYCGGHSKCYHPAHQGYHWKNRDMPEAQPSLRRYLAEGSNVIQKLESLTGSTSANESFQAMKGKYTNKCLNFTILTEALLALGWIVSPNPGPTPARRATRILRHFLIPGRLQQDARGTRIKTPTKK
jgi:hypothetical protein